MEQEQQKPQAGLADIRRALELKPWRHESGPLEGVVIHEMAAPGA